MSAEIGSLKGSLITVLLSTLIIGFCIMPVMAQGVSAGYTIQVSFFYPCICQLTNLHVSVSDQTGIVVANAMSPDGSMLLLTFTKHAPTYWITVSASGDASFAYCLPWAVHGSTHVTVETIGGYYYATIYLTR